MKFIKDHRNFIMATGGHNDPENRYRGVVKRYIGEKLRDCGYQVPGYEGAESPGSPDPIRDTARTLRRVGDELMSANREFFAEMCGALSITPNTAYPTFKGIADEIFSTGKNWGRIVAFLAFGSSLAIHCASRPDLGPGYVDRIVNWTATYMESNLDVWMQDHGSWVSVIQIIFRTFV